MARYVHLEILGKCCHGDCLERMSSWLLSMTFRCRINKIYTFIYVGSVFTIYARGLVLMRGSSVIDGKVHAKVSCLEYDTGLTVRPISILPGIYACICIGSNFKDVHKK